MKRASFINHKVTDEGVYVRGLTAPGFTPDVEIFVPRDDAEQFGWIDPIDGVEDETEQQTKQINRLQGHFAYVLDELESIADAHHNDMSPTPKRRVDELIAFIKAAVPALAPTEKPPKLERPCTDCGQSEAMHQIAYCLDCLHKRYPKQAKKLAEWNAMSQKG
jgi:hypothetical protein